MRAAVYSRISRDATEDGKGVERQREDCLALCERRGWTVTEVYEDNDIGAAGRAKYRPRYEAMLGAARSGEIDVIVAYSNSRLSRRPAEWLDLIGLAQAGKIQIATIASGSHDLTTADGRAVAMTVAIWDAAEAERTAERTKRQKQQDVAEGKPLGQRFRTFGYTRKWEVIEEEAAIVREVFKRAVGGESQNSITRDLVSRGIKTAAGNDWTPLQTSRMLKTPKYAGFQTYKGEIVGKTTVPALVDEATFEAVQNPRNGASFNFRKYLLSGILICDRCKAPMTGTRVVNKGKEGVRYRCEVRSGGCGSVSIKGEWIEGLINRYMSWVAIQEHNTLPKELPPTNSQEIAELDSRIAKFQELMGNGTMDIEDAMAAIKAARASRNKLVREDAARITTEAQSTPIEDYDALTDDEKRVVIRRWFRFIFIKPGRRVRHFDDSRVYVLTADGELKAGGAINTVDLRDGFDQGPDYTFDPARGF